MAWKRWRHISHLHRLDPLLHPENETATTMRNSRCEDVPSIKRKSKLPTNRKTTQVFVRILLNCLNCNCQTNSKSGLGTCVTLGELLARASCDGDSIWCAYVYLYFLTYLWHIYIYIYMYRIYTHSKYQFRYVAKECIVSDVCVLASNDWQLHKPQHQDDTIKANE